MNDKFYEIKTDKQERILNAAIKVFAINGYRKASTDLIVKEASISKGLLFHYFDNKISLYSYIIEYSVRFLTFELNSTVNKNEHDFFELVNQVERVKIKIMKNYPYMLQFLNGLKYETNEDAVSVISGNANILDDIYNSIFRQADNTKFQDYVVISRVVDMIRWMSDGFMRECLIEDRLSVEEMTEEFSKYIKMVKAHFYKGGMVGVDDEDIR